VKQEEKPKKKRGCLKTFLGILGFILLVIIIAVIIGSMSEDEKKPTPTKTETQTEKAITEKKESQLMLSSDDILTSKGVYEGKEIITTQCYVENKTDQDWEGSVKMTAYDTNGNVVYASFDAAWIGISVKAGERDYLLAAIPIEKVAPYRYAGIVIRWEWGKQKAEQIFRF